MRSLALAAAALAVIPAPATAQTADVVYEGASVWTGAGFAPGDLAISDGRFVSLSRVGPGTRRVDAAGRFVVPAYANAHAHITNGDMATSRIFTDAGVYYVWNPNTVVMGEAAKAFWARHDAFDVKIAQGGITEPGGHPERLYVEFLSASVYGGRPLDWFVGNAFHYGATPAEIDAALDLLRSQGADFVKAYLLNSERYDELKDDPAAYGQRGLDPDNLAYLVEAAHARGLPVAVHVETAHDLEVAARAGADVAAHLPGYGRVEPDEMEARRLTPEIAATVAASGIKVIPTYTLIRGPAYDARQPLSLDLAAHVEVQRHNLRLLREAGVVFMIGTDGFGQIWTEAEHMVELGVFSDHDAVAVVLATGALLFPERRIGCFEVGCEADFLVLTADPTRNVSALRRIERRVMQGGDLSGPES